MPAAGHLDGCGSFTSSTLCLPEHRILVTSREARHGQILPGCAGGQVPAGAGDRPGRTAAVQLVVWGRQDALPMSQMQHCDCLGYFTARAPKSLGAEPLLSR